MNERNEIEQLRFNVEQSNMNKDQHVTKSGSLFRCKFKSFRKSPHSISTISTVEKARAFLRSFSLRTRRGNSKEPPSISIDQPPTVNIRCSSTNSMLSIEETKKNVSLLNPIVHTSNISVSKDIKVDKINPKDIILYRLSDNDQDDSSKLPLNYFQQKYKQYLKPTLLIPKQYYNDLLNKRYQSYFTSINRYSLGLRTAVQTLSSHSTESTRIYPPLRYPSNNNESSLSSNQPLISHPIKSSIQDPSLYDQPAIPLVAAIPSSSSSSSSILAWNQCVDRLNTEYRSTINALQRTKEYLEEIYQNSKHNHSIVRDTTNLSNHATKKSPTVTFRLPSPTISDRFSPRNSINEIEQSKIISPVVFSKPKVVKLTELNAFPPSPKLESSLLIREKDEKPDSIANIIKKFNNLSTSEPSSAIKSPININKTNERLQSKPCPQEDETTTYTIETFYKHNNDQKTNYSSKDQQVIITQEKTTAAEFNSIYSQQQQTSISTMHDNCSSDPISSDCDINTTSTTSTPSLPLKSSNRFISQIPKRSATTTMHAIRLKQSSKSSPSTITNNTMIPILKPKELTLNKTSIQSTTTSTKQLLLTDKNTTDPRPSLNKNCVKSIIRQLNTNASPYSTVSSSIANKRTCRRISFQPSVFTSKNIV